MLLRMIAFATFALLCAGLTASPGNAVTYYVAGNASSSNTACSSTAPCNDLGKALANAHAGDAIVCVSPPVATALNITVSVSIDCSGTRAPHRDASYNNGSAGVGIAINIPPSTIDPLRTVRLRGLTIDGASPGNPPDGRYLDRGIDIQAAKTVYIEDCVISNVKQQGILDRRTGGQTKLFIKDTIVSGNGSAGIALGAQGPNTNVLDNVSTEYNRYGLAAATGNNVLINRSVFSGNSTAGIEGDVGAQIAVDNSVISHNDIGVQSNSSVRLFNNHIAFNSSAITGSSASLGQNRFSGNSTLGTAPTAIAGASANIGP